MDLKRGKKCNNAHVSLVYIFLRVFHGVFETCVQAKDKPTPIVTYIFLKVAIINVSNDHEHT